MPTGSQDQTEIEEENPRAVMPQIDSFRLAFHNVALLVFTLLCAGAIAAAYNLFSDFMKPLIWAVICGIVLYPLKREMTTVVTNWLDDLIDNSTPVLISLVFMPIRLINSLGDWMFDTIIGHKLPVALIAISIPVSSLVLQNGFLPSTLLMITKLLRVIDLTVGLLPHSSMVLVIFTLFQAYLISSYWITSIHTYWLHNGYMSGTIWTLMIAYLSNFMGPLRAIVFLGVILTSLICWLFYPVVEDVKPSSISRNPSMSSIKGGRISQISMTKLQKRRGSKRDSISTTASQQPLIEVETKSVDEESEGDLYIKWLLAGCFFVYVSLHLWLVPLLMLPLILGGLKRLAIAFGIPSLIEQFWDKMSSSEISELIVPVWIRNVSNVLVKADKQFIYYLKSSMDTVGSVVAMLMLGVGIVTVSIFLMIQLYYESVHMINLGSSIANQTLADNRKFQMWIKETTNSTSVNDLADQLLKKGYDYGKFWVSSQVREIIDDTVKAELLEEQIFTIADRMYSAWAPAENNSIAEIPKASVAGGWTQLWSLTDSSENLDPTARFVEMLQSNVAILWSVIDHTWAIFASNAELLLNGLSEIFTTLFESGTAIIDFVLDTIVFLSILFQLLCSSGEKFRPLEVLQQMSPAEGAAAQISADIESAVSGVFTVSLKMSVFYGLYTWLTHTVMAVNLVFIPSLLAAIFAAIPFFGPYLVSIPAVLELWVIRGEPYLAILMFLLSYIPGYIVDDAIYSEIKTTNPLLTGMSIAGGMVIWGLEGVIFGPIVLCCIFVMMSIYNNIITDMRTWRP